MKRSSKPHPAWKTDLMLRFRAFILSKHNKYWDNAIVQLTEDDVYETVGKAYAVSGWVTRMQEALGERDQTADLVNGHFVYNLKFYKGRYPISISEWVSKAPIEEIKLYLKTQLDRKLPGLPKPSLYDSCKPVIWEAADHPEVFKLGPGVEHSFTFKETLASADAAVATMWNVGLPGKGLVTIPSKHVWGQDIIPVPKGDFE